MVKSLNVIFRKSFLITMSNSFKQIWWHWQIEKKRSSWLFQDVQDWGGGFQHWPCHGEKMSIRPPFSFTWPYPEFIVTSRVEQLCRPNWLIRSFIHVMIHLIIYYFIHLTIYLNLFIQPIILKTQSNTQSII